MPLVIPLNSLRWCFWIAYFVQFSLSAAVLGIAGNEAYKLTNQLPCQILPKLDWNIACAAISVVGLLLLLFTDRPFSRLTTQPWLNISFFNKHYGRRVLICAFFLVLWLSAAAASVYTCPGLCDACPAATWLVYAGRFCPCTADAVAIADDGGFEITSKRARDYEHKRALDIAITVLFALMTLAAMLFKWARPATIEEPSLQHDAEQQPNDSHSYSIKANASQKQDGDVAQETKSKPDLPTYTQALNE